MFQLLLKGGPIMFFLLGCSFLGVYITFQKLLYLKANNVNATPYLTHVKKSLQKNGKELTINQLKLDKTLMSQIMSDAITASEYEKEDAERILESKIEKSLIPLDSNMTLLTTLITVSPILGLMGTVLGLIDIFNVISGGNLGDAMALSGGIAKALLTTMMGLMIAIPLIFIHHFLSKKISLFINDIETNAFDILSFCKNKRGHDLSHV